jgi:hypothetical protein
MEAKKYAIRTLNKYVNERRIERNPHPTLPIAIYNYSRETQFKNDWDEVTLDMRGTIIDDKGYVVASAFRKFFNYEEVIDQVPVKGDYVYVQEGDKVNCKGFDKGKVAECEADERSVIKGK